MEFIEIKRILAEEAANRGIEEYELYYSSETSVSTETLKNEISAFSSGTNCGLCFRCLVDGKMGYASTELFDEEELRSLVIRAAENATAIEKADEVIFAGSPSYGTLEPREYTPMSAAELKKMALEIQKNNYEADERVTDGTQAAAVTVSAEIRLCNSHGLDLMRSAGATMVYAAPVIKDGDESQESFKVELYNGENDLKALAKDTVVQAIEKIGAGNVKSGKYNVIIDGKQMRVMLSAFFPAFSAKQAQSGMSLLAGKEGETVASDVITITDDPMRDGNPFITNFDAEGVVARKKTVIDKGVLKTLLYNLETAKKAGVESTGNASKGSYASPVGISPYAFCIEAGDNSLDQLFEMAGDGVYVTEIKGLHAGANAVTGDFSIESAGFMIENGKKGRAVKSFTIAGNFFELLKSAYALSDTVETGVPGGLTVFGSPAILIMDMSIAGE